jgi:hypothetical protein
MANLEVVKCFGYLFMRVFLPDKALAAAGVYSENVLEQLAPST